MIWGWNKMYKRVVVIGDSKVGKTSLLKTVFKKDYDQTDGFGLSICAGKLPIKPHLDVVIIEITPDLIPITRIYAELATAQAIIVVVSDLCHSATLDTYAKLVAEYKSKVINVVVTPSGKSRQLPAGFLGVALDDAATTTSLSVNLAIKLLV